VTGVQIFASFSSKKPIWILRQKFERTTGGNNPSKKMPAIINWRSCEDSEIQNAYPDFFRTIREHKAHKLYGQWAISLGVPRDAFQPPHDMKEYYKEKKKLMAILRGIMEPCGNCDRITACVKQLCVQPGAVIDRILWNDWLVRPGT
jgi:hypothetical protein